jgi:ankyrin repeat protein
LALVAAAATPTLAQDGGADLVAAAEAGDAQVVRALIRDDIDPSAASADGTTALHWAAYNGDAEMAELLLRAGADPNAKNDYGATPLYGAAMAADTGLIETLLEGGADPEIANPDGQTPLMVVARSGNVAAAEAMLERGADPNAAEQWRGQTALIWAAAQSRPEMITLLIEHDAAPDARGHVNNWERQVSGEPRAQYREIGGLTPLLYAAREGCGECVKRLVAGDATIDLPDPQGVTPLIIAINNLHFDTAKALIEAGANVDKWDWWGRSPLYAAVDMNTLPDGGREDRPSTDQTSGLDVIRLLLERGANPNPRLKLFPPYRHVEDDRGCDLMLNIGTTPLLRAAKTFDAPAIALLLEHGADVNRPNVDGVTPIMAAAGTWSVECDVRGGPGYLTAGVQERSIAALDLLLQAGADINARDDLERGSYSQYRGQTALHGAAFWGWDDVVRYLVEHGARIDVRDKDGMTPVDSAMGRAGGHGRGDAIELHEDTAALLRELCAQDPSCELPPEPAAPAG